LKKRTPDQLPQKTVILSKFQSLQANLPIQKLISGGASSTRAKPALFEMRSSSAQV